VRYRLLVAMPFVAVAALWAALALVPAARHTTLYSVEVELAKCAALVGCAVAATRFGRGDYLRTAWLLFGQCYLFILGNDIFLRAGLGIVADRPWAPLTSSIVIFVANVGQLVGVIMIARVWRVAGFELAGSPSVRLAVRIGAFVIAVVAAGNLTLMSAREFAHGQTASLVDVFSSVADIVSFALIAPFLLTAIALRGGSLVWTWALLTLSMFGWLLFDTTLSFASLLPGADVVTRVSESARLLACTFGLAAGLAQRLAVGGVAMPAVATAATAADAQG
jgi:hypothetical protein